MDSLGEEMIKDQFHHMIDRCLENPNHVVGISLKIPKFVQKLAQSQKHF